MTSVCIFRLYWTGQHIFTTISNKRIYITHVQAQGKLIGTAHAAAPRNLVVRGATQSCREEFPTLRMAAHPEEYHSDGQESQESYLPDARTIHTQSVPVYHSVAC